MKRLINIQAELKAPKKQLNNFGRYKYRNLEDILEALKPLLFKHKLALIISDDIVAILDRVYIKATAKLVDENNKILVENSAFAREDLAKKGMDVSQLTGATSSYARKYCLNGMFLIDDTRDADSMNNINKSNNINNNSEKIEVIDSINNLSKIKNADLNKTLAFFQVKKLEDLSVERLLQILDKIKSM